MTLLLFKNYDLPIEARYELLFTGHNPIGLKDKRQVNIWAYIFDSENFLLGKFFTRKIFDSENFRLGKFSTRKIFDLENFRLGKFSTRKIFYSENFRLGKFSTRKIFDSENISTLANLHRMLN